MRSIHCKDKQRNKSSERLEGDDEQFEHNHRDCGNNITNQLNVKVRLPGIWCNENMLL